ncbi:MAG: tetratricopeptide repeat protein [Thermodesulfovibrionales bacterium]|nr:tetratricopeptide repeat protein [Thermodesulfovibrionales bacterium]
MISNEKLKMLEYYNKGLELYRSRHFVEAKEYFQKCLSLVPDDGPSAVYIERCDYFIKNPPPENWDGVFVMTTK